MTVGPAQGVAGASAEKCGWFWCCIVKTEKKIFVCERERERVCEMGQEIKG